MKRTSGSQKKIRGRSTQGVFSDVITAFGATEKNPSETPNDMFVLSTQTVGIHASALFSSGKNTPHRIIKLLHE